MAKSAQQRYLEKEIEQVVCACGCGGIVIRRQLHFFPSYLKKTGGKLPRFVVGHSSRTPEAKERSRENLLKARGKRGTQKPSFGEDAPHWKGGRTIGQGYAYIRQGSGYIAEHRLVLERKLGRSLTSDEVVHHKDGNRLNNKTDNLKLITAAEHAKRHPQARDAFGRFRRETNGG